MKLLLISILVEFDISFSINKFIILFLRNHLCFPILDFSNIDKHLFIIEYLLILLGIYLDFYNFHLIFYPLLPK